MQFQEIKPTTISETIAQQIESNILDGGLVAGDKLPAERELAKQFNVSRPSIREAINKLQAKGIVTKTPGGGTYVADTVGTSFSDPLLDLIANNPDASYDMLELRYAVEGLAAYFAAQRCTEADKDLIRLRHDELDLAHKNDDSKAEATADVNFHLSIAEAAHNPVLLHIMRNLFNVLQQSVVISFKDLFSQPDPEETIPHQHKAVMEAVLNNDAEGAMKAMQTHIAWVETRLVKLRQDRSNNQRHINRGNNLKDLNKDK